MEHRDEIDKWLFEEFQLLPGCCASQLDLQYRTARMVAEKLWLEKQKEQNPIVIQVENPNIQKLDTNVIIETRTDGTGEPYREPIPGVKKVF